MKRSDDKKVTAIVSIRIDENSAGFADAPVVRRELDEITGVNGVIFDLSVVRVVASGIIGVMLGQMLKTNIAIIATTDNLWHVIRMMRLDSMIPVFDDVTAAYEHLMSLTNSGVRQHV